MVALKAAGVAEGVQLATATEAHVQAEAELQADGGGWRRQCDSGQCGRGECGRGARQFS